MVALVAIAGLLRVWRYGTVAMELKAALLVTTTLLITPYAFEYDATMMALPIAWSACYSYRHGWLAHEKAILAIGWTMPLLASVLAEVSNLQIGAVVIALIYWSIYRRSRAAT